MSGSPPICLSAHLINLSVGLCLSVCYYLSVCLNLFVCLRLSVFQSVCSTICKSVRLCACLSFSLSSHYFSLSSVSIVPHLTLSNFLSLCFFFSPFSLSLSLSLSFSLSFPSLSPSRPRICHLVSVIIVVEFDRNYFSRNEISNFFKLFTLNDN